MQRNSLNLNVLKLCIATFFFSKATVSPYWLFEYHFFPSHYSVILATHENKCDNALMRNGPWLKLVN